MPAGLTSARAPGLTGSLHLLLRQVLSEVTEDNLIDLGPGSPAVVSPMVGSTAPPPSLSSQLAGLGEYLLRVKDLFAGPFLAESRQMPSFCWKAREPFGSPWQSVFLSPDQLHHLQFIPSFPNLKL